MAVYTITNNFGMMPVQIEGHTDDGRHFYFRCDGDYWSLGFGATADEALFSDDYEGELIGAGYFESDQAQALFWDVIKSCVENGFTYPQAAIKQVEYYKRAFQDLHDEILPRSTGWSIPVHEVISLIRKHHPEWRA